jgi:hypothetical protein
MASAAISPEVGALVNEEIATSGIRRLRLALLAIPSYGGNDTIISLGEGL